MRNGGGPACLRLRVVLTERRTNNKAHPGVFLTDKLYQELKEWIELPLPGSTCFHADLADPLLWQKK